MIGFVGAEVRRILEVALNKRGFIPRNLAFGVTLLLFQLVRNEKKEITWEFFTAIRHPILPTPVGSFFQFLAKLLCEINTSGAIISKKNFTAHCFCN